MAHTTTPLLSSPQSSIKKSTVLVILDSAVPDGSVLSAGMLDGTAVEWLDASQDGVLQISEILRRYPQITELHLLSHGAPGTLFLGKTQLSTKNLDYYAWELQSWFSTSQPQMLIYGCEVASGETGTAFVNQLQQLMGVAIASSPHRVGSPTQGGTWTLTATTEFPPAPIPLQPEVMNAYTGILGIALREVGFYNNASVVDVDVVGNRAYITDTTNTFRILDVTIPSSPFQINSLAIFNLNGWALHLEIADNLAYLNSFDGMFGSTVKVFDISNPSNPAQTATLTHGGSMIGGKIWDIEAKNGITYIGGDLGLKTYDGTADLGTISTPEAIRDLNLTGNFAYAAVGYSGVQIFDIANPTPSLLSSFDTPGEASDVEIAGNLAYIADGSQGVQIFDLTDPTASVGSFTGMTDAQDIALAGNLAYVAGGSSGLYLLDVTDPANPILLDQFDTLDYAQNVEAVGNFVYVADKAGGLRIFTLNSPPTTQNTAILAIENLDRVFSSSDFPFTDLDTSDQSNLKSVKITELPQAGVLYLDQDANGFTSGEAISVGQEIPVQTLSQLKFRPDETIGSIETSLSFQVSDGDAYSQIATMAIAIIDTDPLQVNVNGQPIPLTDAIDFLNDQVALLGDDITDLQDQNQQLLVQVDLLTDQNEELLGYVDLFTGQITLLDQQNQELTGQVDLLTGEITLLNNQNQTLTGQVNLLTGKITLLTDQNKEITGQLDLFNTQNQTITDHVNALLLQNQQLTDQLNSLANQLKALTLPTEEPPLPPPPQVIVEETTTVSVELLTIDFGSISWDTSASGSGEGDRFNGSTRNDRFNGKSGNDSIKGEEGSDFLFGHTGNDHLEGGEGSDKLDGGIGNDKLSGGDGRDLILGGAGQDKLAGGLDNDILVGGFGPDSMNGGLGADVFRYNNVAEGSDVIRGFNPAEDVIDLRLLFEQPMFSGVVGSDRYRYINLIEGNGGVQVQMNVGGDLSNPQFITLATLKAVALNAINLESVITVN